MRDGSEIEALLDSLETLFEEAEGKRDKWKDVWNEVKSIGQTFKESRFPTVQDRQAAWNRFQYIIANVKACQERAKEIFEERVRESKYHLEKILYSYAERATPSSESADAILAICTGGLSILIKAGIEAILGPFDERKLELQKCNEALKEGWAYLSQNKAEMLGKHKKEAFEALNKTSEALHEAWYIWKSARREAIEQYHAEKQAAWEARQAKREAWIAKKEAWEERMKENISKLEHRIDQLENVLDRRQSNLSKLEDMRDSAWSDSYSDRVNGWIDEENDRIRDIERKIDQIKGWISDMTAKLR
jgi:hypothetical protein